MRSDDPTVPNLGWYAPGAASDPGAAGERPTWPTGGERPSRTLGPARPPSGYVSALVFGVSLGANVVLLLCLLGLLLLSHAGVFAPGGSAGSPAPGAALSSPTATSSPTPLSGWLRVTPSSVQLGCDAGQRTQFVVLENTGPQKVSWQAVVAGPADQAGVAISPDHGDLDAGASLPLQIQNITHSSGSQGVSSEQGVIRFAPAAAEAGAPPSLSYTTVGCQ